MATADHLLALLALGFFLGMRHATDADHVVAVSTIVSRERTPRAALAVGLLWGLGHTAMILLVGGGIVLFGLVIPPRVGLSLEMSVAVMLIVLGALNVRGAVRRIDEVAHGHAHPARAPSAVGLRPLLVGLVHGLAGSAAIALLVLATVRDARSALLYLGVFGLGTVLGMMLLTVAMFAPLAVAARRFVSFERNVARVTGLISVALGLLLVYQIGFSQGLLLAK